jgi:3-oxoacyl-[acyl-carrier-protein] synthase II
MAEPIAITGLGVVSAAGVTRDDFFAALADGRTGVAADPNLTATGFPLVARVGEFGIKQHVEARALRRIVRMAQMGLVACKQALAQAAPAATPERTGIIFGTGLGTLRETVDFLSGLIRDGVGQGSPLLFPSSVMNASAGQVALELGLRGPNSTVNHREESPFGALAMACDLLALGRADAILAGGLDELGEPTHHGYRRLGGLSPTGIHPYSRGRDGTVLGEGACVMLLERAADARARGAKVLATIAAISSAGDRRPRIGWGKGHSGAATAIRAALDEAKLSAGEVGYVAGGGNGLGVDGEEARAVAEALGPDRPYGSIVGQVGEFMGGGALRVAAGIYALQMQALPGTTGYTGRDAELPIENLVEKPRAGKVEAVLVPSLAQGGADTAIVLTR